MPDSPGGQPVIDGMPTCPTVCRYIYPQREISGIESLRVKGVNDHLLISLQGME
jgi:hypothetical protein